MSEPIRYWFFHIPNILLAAALYTLMGRYLLSLVFKAESQTVIWRVFCQITNPIVAAVRAVTPAIVPNGLLLIFGVVWILLLRMILLLVATMFGFLPKLGV